MFAKLRSCKKWPTIVASLRLIIYCLLSYWDNSTLICCPCQPTVTWHQGQGHQNEHIYIYYIIYYIIYAMHKSTTMPSLNATEKRSYRPLVRLSSQQTWWRLLEHWWFSWLRSVVTLNEGQGQYNMNTWCVNNTCLRQSPCHFCQVWWWWHQYFPRNRLQIKGNKNRHTHTQTDPGSSTFKKHSL